MPDTVRLRGFTTLTDGIAVEFLRPVPTDVRCVVCGDVVGILWRSKCRHNFCTQCLENLLGQGNKSFCPVDSEDIHRNELTRDASIQEVVAALEIHCLNRGTGCEEVLRVGTVNEHLQECTALAEMPSRPPRRIDQPSPATSMQDEQQVGCCSATQDVAMSGTCWMSSLGCNFEGSQADLEAHESDWELHRQLVVTRMSEYRRNMEDVLGERDLLRNQLNEAHGTIKELKGDFERHVEECSKRNDTLQQQLRDMSFRITMVERETSRQQLPDFRIGSSESCSSNMNAAANLPSAPSEPFASMQSGFTVNSHSMVITGEADDVVCPDGTFLWRLSEYSRARRRERHGPKRYTSSPAFYAGNPGYHLKLRLFLNGIGQSRRGKFVAVNLVLMQGRHDDQLPWPFRQKVTVMLLDQTGDHHVCFTINDPGFPRPLTEYTIPYIWQEFVTIEDLENRYLRGDSLVFKVVVEPPQPPPALYPNLLG